MRTFHGFLAGMVLAVVLPAVLFGFATAWWLTVELQRNRQEEAARLAGAIAGDVAAYVRTVEAAMQVLGRSPAVVTGDFATAYRHAQALATDLGQHFVLSDKDNRQIFNTRRPFGSALPPRTNITSSARAMETGKVSVSDVFIGAVAQAPLITVDIPLSGPQGPLVLGSSTDVAVLETILARTALPQGWSSSLFDSQGSTIAGRSISDPAAPRLSHAVPATGWTVTVAWPGGLAASLTTPFTLLGGGAASALVLTLLLGLTLGRRLNRAADQLAEAVRALGRGELPPVIDGFAETQEISAVARQVAQELRAREQRIESESAERDISERRLRLFTEVVPAGIAMFDRDMRYLAASRRYAADFGIPMEGLIGRCHYDVFPDIPDRWKDIHRRCLGGATERCLEDPFPRADGTLDWVSWEIRPWYETSGRVGGVVLASEVITWRKNVESKLRAARDAAEAAAASKARFFAAAGHDLRQPLQALGLFLDVLRPTLTAQQLPIFQNVDKSRDAITDLLTALLDMAKLDAGIVAPNPILLPIDHLVASIGAECRSAAETKRLHLRLRPVAGTVVSDRLMLERILRNLVINAIRYTDRGGVLLAARRRGDRIRFEVWDTGIGIDRDRLQLVWEEFYQVANATRDRTHGLGLGLSIVQRLTRLLEHPVGVRSRLGKGSVFWVEVPATFSASAPPIATLERQL